MTSIKKKSDPNYKPSNDGGIHLTVQKFWEKRFKSNQGQYNLTRYLRSLRIQRNKADYDLGISHERKHADKNVKMSILLNQVVAMEK